MSTQDIIEGWENGIEPYTLGFAGQTSQDTIDAFPRQPKKARRRSVRPIRGLAEQMATLTGKPIKNTVAGFTESTIRRLVALSIPKARQRL